MQNLTFSEDFFKGEEIDGFYVEPLMKRTWAAELKVLNIVDDICARNGIKYFVSWGTLLGAVRHRGFIPWDDDIDIMMMRSDYLKFLSIAESQLPKHYKLSSFYSTPEHNQPFAALLNRETVYEDKDITEEYYGCPFIIGMDITPFDYIPRDMEIRDVHRRLYMAAYDLAQNYYEYEAAGEAEDLLGQLEEISGAKVNRAGSIRSEIWKLSERILMMFTESECDHVAYTPAYAAQPDGRPFPKEMFDREVRLPFTGGLMVPAPVDYHEHLEILFGSNYMTPINTPNHEYPFYKSQIEYLKKMGIEV